MKTIGKNNQDMNTYNIINSMQNDIIDNINYSVSTKQLTAAICNYFDNEDISSFLEFLHDENIINIDELN